jgi:large subunit ribosomal protein L29
VSAAHLRDLAHEELVEKLDEAKEELFNLRFQLATNQLDNSARIKEVKKEIARINTVIRQQEIEAWRALQAAGKET